MSSREWTTCSGCGLRLPVAGAVADPRYDASAECLAVYYDVTARAMSDPLLGGLHQLTVDAYWCQHAAPGAPTIRTAFALLGLHWTLDRGLSGLQVRAAHQRLAQAAKQWPAFERPRHAGELTVLGVASATDAARYRDAVFGWGRSVWEGWAIAHARVTELTERYWPLIASAGAGAARER